MKTNKNGGVFVNGKRYSHEVYLRVLQALRVRDKAIQKGHKCESIRRIAKKNFVSPGFVHKLLENTVPRVRVYKYKKRGGNNHKHVKASPQVIEFLQHLYNLNPLWQLKQAQKILQGVFNIKFSLSYIFYLVRHKLKLRRRRISHIAKKRASIRIKAWRNAFADYAKDLDPFSIVFFDESYFTFHDAVPKYAYVQKTNAIELPIQKVSRKRFSLLAAMTATNIMHWQIVDATNGGTVNDNTVATFLRHLLTLLPDESVILMDNASIHHSPEVKLLTEANSSKFLFTSAYSPDFNAIELLFGRTKMLLKNHYCSSNSLVHLVGRILKETPSSVLASFVSHTFHNYQNCNEHI